MKKFKYLWFDDEIRYKENVLVAIAVRIDYGKYYKAKIVENVKISYEGDNEYYHHGDNIYTFNWKEVNGEKCRIVGMMPQRQYHDMIESAKRNREELLIDYYYQED